MAIEAVEHYLYNILAPELKGYGVSDDFTKYTVDTVGIQIYSCLRHWTDVSFRKALLIIGSEEGTFYEPAGKIEVKCFIVVTIRNSPFETLQSTNFAETGLMSELSDDGIKSVTKAAITYFNKLDFMELSKQAQDSEEYDIYGELAKKYPVSWKALEQLAGAVSKKTEYTKALFTEPFGLEGIEDADTKGYGAVLDGYSPAIDAQLSKALYSIVEYDIPFLVDCFKMLTRNIEKLLKVMEFVLTHERAFVTSNYYIENGYIERRIKLIKAAHTDREFIAHSRQILGLGYKHAAVLKDMYSSFDSKINQ